MKTYIKFIINLFNISFLKIFTIFFIIIWISGILEEVNFRICPISYDDAQEMISSLKIKNIFNEFRGHKLNSQEKMIELLLKIGGDGGVIDSLGDNFSELDLNPVVLTSNHPVVLDAQLLLKYNL